MIQYVFCYDSEEPLPLPDKLQRIVDGAPQNRAELDTYFEDALHRTWSDPATLALGRAIYLEKTLGLSVAHLSVEEYQDISFFAAEMRAKRDGALDN